MIQERKDLHIGIFDGNIYWLREMCGLVKQAGYKTHTTNDGTTALELASELIDDRHIDLLLLGDEFTVGESYRILTEIREYSPTLPIIALGQSDEEDHKISMLKRGADYYLVKSEVYNQELIARIKALMRRVKLSGNHQSPISITNEEFMIMFPSYTVTMSGQEVDLTKTEYELVACLARNIGRRVSHKELLAEIWGNWMETLSEDDLHLLRTNINRLRRKLEQNPREPHYLLTHRYNGYWMPNYNQHG